MQIQTQKITANIPIGLLKSAQEVTHKGVTETLREALSMLAKSKSYDHLLSGYGKVKTSIDLKSLRKD